MYVLLLLLGAATAAAGGALVASALTGHDSAFDITTPSTVAAVGGLILIGLGLVVRGLERVERALAGREVTHSPQTAAARAAVGHPEAPQRMPYPAEAQVDGHPQSATAAANIASGSDEDSAAVENIREGSPLLSRLEKPAVLGDAAISLLLQVPARAEESPGELDDMSAAGSASARGAPRIEVPVRPSGPPEPNKFSLFDSFWPKSQHVKRKVPVPSQAAAPPFVIPANSKQAGETPSDAVRSEPRAMQSADLTSVSILKSGVVEGMAYTLYSDGSIEAQLPQGPVRFGSITELRNHVERSS